MLIRIFENMRGMDVSDIAIQIMATVAAVLICLIVHEICHGLAAYALGDPTAKRMGRFSFNPVRHIDPIGGLMLLLLGFGWAKPVMVDPRYFENPKRDMALTALAGPVSNFILAFLSMGLLANTARWALGAGLVGAALFSFLRTLVFLNIGLGVFNLIPIPPLDGSKVLGAFLPDRMYWQLMRFERYGMFILLFLLMFGRIDLNRFVNGIFNAMLGVWT
ncbi:MAG: site-2 protease family protein [Oscillospiraceae bacterium]|nr:site-2 protease family protein [Oscillospiraceae bacterium]